MTKVVTRRDVYASPDESHTPRRTKLSAFNEGERVEYAYPEPQAEPSELRGVVVEVIVQYRIRWDDGSTYVHDVDDLKKES